MGRAIQFMIFMWFMVSIAGGIYSGSVSASTTVLTSDLAIDETDHIDVASTTNFPDTGIVVIGDEKIAYAAKTATTLDRTDVLGVSINPMTRGVGSTVAAAHTTGDRVRTVESAMLNSSMDYKIATLTDAAGVTAFVTIPYSFLSLIVSFFILPIAFLGSDLQILTYLWAVLTIGLVVTIAISLAGGRRV